MSIFVQKRKKEKGEKIRGIIGYINKKKEKKKIVGGTAFLTSTRFTAGTQYR